MSVVEHRQAGRLNASFVIFPPISLLIVASLFSARLKSLTPAPIFGLARCNKPIMEANRYHAQAGVGRKFQKPTVFEDQTVFENLLLALKNHRNVFRVLFYKRRKSDHQKVEDLARDISLDNALHRLAGELSHGQKQWLEIGMLLAQDPKLLLVDEPAAGMTATEREKTTAMLVNAAKTRAVVVVEHDMEFVRRLECKVTVLHEGAVLAEGRLDHVTANQDVLDVYLGR
ncbi:ATP-binding cassette domain-containing protein [Paracoccaceae bacterium]|nr:ATP-binding cassette domain-containing protein [Paracoccaceae bacterium]